MNCDPEIFLLDQLLESLLAMKSATGVTIFMQPLTLRWDSPEDFKTSYEALLGQVLLFLYSIVE